MEALVELLVGQATAVPCGRVRDKAWGAGRRPKLVAYVWALPCLEAYMAQGLQAYRRLEPSLRGAHFRGAGPPP